jgi:hypothetical protein
MVGLARIRRPLNVVLAPDSLAERVYHDRKGLPGQEGGDTEARAPGTPATPEHDLVFHGGKTIADLHFVNFYVGGKAAWQSSAVESIDHSLAAAMSDPHLNNVMAQYFPHRNISAVFDRSETLEGPRPGIVTKADIERRVAKMFSDKTLGGADLATTVFNYMLPSGTVLTDDDTPSGQHPRHRLEGMPDRGDEADSRHGLGGYHGSVHPPATGRQKVTVYYAVGVYSERRPDGSVNGIAVWDDPWKNVVATFYHELQEARTDADVGDAIRAGNDPDALRFVGWISASGEECGDFPVFEARPLTQVFQEVPLANGSGTVPVQFQYSNAVHGPEGPIARPHPSK